MRTLVRLAVAAALALSSGCATTRPGAVVTDQGATSMVTTEPRIARGETIAPGTTLLVRLEEPIGTDVSRPGQTFRASVLTPVVDPGGQPIVPAGSEVTGRVVELREGGLDNPAVVGLAFDRLRVGDASVPVTARVLSTDVEASRKGVRPVPILAGAAGGALLGGLLGEGTGALLGAGLGAGAGTLISLGTSKTEARLPQGTAIAIELESAIPVAAIAPTRRRF